MPLRTDHLQLAAEEDWASFLNGPVNSYEQLRNFDFGPDNRSNVSCLSKYISHRTLFEFDIIATTLASHRLENVEKFVQEVFWRVYWTGWLEHRPTVWDDFVSFRFDLASNSTYQSAIKGNTGISCFDSWVNELQENNYLHNHWFFFQCMCLSFLSLACLLFAIFEHSHHILSPLENRLT